jgi:hypothetical protein
VDVTWDFWSDEAVDRFTLYRRHGASPSVVIASGDARTTRAYTDKSVEPGETYYYEVVIRNAGRDEFRSLVATATVARLAASLSQNYPNPFNPVTRIGYVLPTDMKVALTVYDVNGRVVERLVNGFQSGGEHMIEWNATGIASGVYFYRLQTRDFVETRRMILLK